MGSNRFCRYSRNSLLSSRVCMPRLHHRPASAGHANSGDDGRIRWVVRLSLPLPTPTRAVISNSLYGETRPVWVGLTPAVACMASGLNCTPADSSLSEWVITKIFFTWLRLVCLCKRKFAYSFLSDYHISKYKQRLMASSVLDNNFLM